MANLIPYDVKRFRAAIIQVIVFIFLAAIGLTSLCIIVIYGFSNVRWFLLLKVFVLFTAPFSLLCALILNWIYTYGFSSDGIYAYSWWGVRRYIKWKDVLKVRKFSVGNLTCIRIYSSIDGRVAWLPLFQSHPVEFREEIQKLAPPNNPLLGYLN